MDAEGFLAPDATFHHIGVACRDLEAEQSALRGLGYRSIGEPFTDLHQGVTGTFLQGPGPQLELLAPLAEPSVLSPWLQGRAKMYHLAYEVDDLDRDLAAAADAGARQAAAPAPAVAFGGRRICFVMLRNMFLVELIER